MFEWLDQEQNDRAIGLLISQFFKDDFKLFDPHFAKEASGLLDLWMNCLKDDSPFILDYSERITSALNLFLYLNLCERKRLEKGEGDPEKANFSKKEVIESIKKQYLDVLVRTVEAGLTAI